MRGIKEVGRCAGLLFGLLVWSSVASAAIIAVDEKQPFIDLSGDLEYLEDPNRALTFDRAMAAIGWQSAAGKSPSLGLTTSAYWFRITLDHSRGTDSIDRILELSYRDIDDLQVWLSDSSAGPTFHTGNRHPTSTRAIHSRLFAFPLELQRGETRTIVLRMTSADALIVPLHLWIPQAFVSKEHDLLTVQGIFYGILLVMLFYNGFLFVSIRERTYLLYCGYIFGTLLVQMIMDGTAHLYLYPPDDPIFGERYAVTRITLGFLLMCLTLFTRDFLHLTQLRPTLGKALSTLAGLGVAIMVVTPWFDYADVYFTILVICGVGVVTAVVCGVVSLVDGYGPARYFMAAFVFYFLGALITIGGVLGLPIPSFWTQHGLQMGSALEVTLLSLALADRINLSETARVKAEQEAADKQRAEAEARRDLEHSRQTLVQNEKLANLGTMISGLGHEIANPINTTSMGLNEIEKQLTDLKNQLLPIFDGSPDADTFKKVLNEKFDDIETTRDYLEQSTQRICALSDALRAQARNERFVTEVVDLNEVIREALVLTRAKTITITVESSLGELPPISCFRTQIGQVATNLISNAADALLERKDQVNDRSFIGKIEVTTEVQQRDEIPGVLITVSDNGTGVPEEVKEKIFDQFFTTKESGVGTGLGLYMCASIVRDHGGILSVDEDPTLGGARFQLWLPNVLEPADDDPGAS